MATNPEKMNLSHSLDKDGVVTKPKQVLGPLGKILRTLSDGQGRTSVEPCRPGGGS